MLAPIFCSNLSMSNTKLSQVLVFQHNSSPSSSCVTHESSVQNLLCCPPFLLCVQSPEFIYFDETYNIWASVAEMVEVSIMLPVPNTILSPVPPYRCVSTLFSQSPSQPTFIICVNVRACETYVHICLISILLLAHLVSSEMTI